MQGHNRVIIAGTVTKDPQQGGTIGATNHMCRLSIATNRTWKDKTTGDKKEETEFHTVVGFGNTAGIWAQYIQKGSNILIEGRLKTRKYQKDGRDTWATDIIAEQFTFLPDNQKRGVASGTRPQANSADQHAYNKRMEASSGKQSNHEWAAPEKGQVGYTPPETDDIPF